MAGVAERDGTAGVQLQARLFRQTTDAILGQEVGHSVAGIQQSRFLQVNGAWQCSGNASRAGLGFAGIIISRTRIDELHLTVVQIRFHVLRGGQIMRLKIHFEHRRFWADRSVGYIVTLLYPTFIAAVQNTDVIMAQNLESPINAGCTVGVLSLTAFIHRQQRLEQPLLDFKVFQSHVFTVTTLLSVLVFTLLIGSQTIIPLYVQSVLGLTALQAGLILLPGAVVMGIVSPLAGRLFDRIGIQNMAIAGFCLLAMAMLFLAMMTESVHPGWITAASTIQMMGATLLMMPLMTAGVNSLPVPLIAHAAAMNNTLRMVGASIGTAMLITILSTRASQGGSPGSPEALATGIQLAFWCAFSIALIGLATTFWLRYFILREKRAGNAPIQSQGRE